MKAIKFNEPHAAWMKKGIKTMLVTSEEIDEGQYVAVGLKAYGELTITNHRNVTIKEFKEMRDQHRISEDERLEYAKSDSSWKQGPLHTYGITFAPYEKDLDYDLDEPEDAEKKADTTLFFDIKMDKDDRKPGPARIEIILEDIDGKDAAEIAKMLMKVIEKYNTDVHQHILKEAVPSVINISTDTSNEFDWTTYTDSDGTTTITFNQALGDTIKVDDIIMKPKGPWGEGFKECREWVKRNKPDITDVDGYCGGIHQRQQEAMRKEEDEVEIKYLESPTSWEVVFAEGKSIKFPKESFPCVCSVRALESQLVSLMMTEAIEE